MKKVLLWFQDRRNLGLLTLSFGYLLILAFMSPIYNKAFHDDFAFAQSARTFVETGNLKVSEWSTPTLIFQILWGGLFSKLFGFSLAGLTLSTVVIFYVGLVAFYYLLTELDVNIFRSVAFTFFLFSFPWIFLFTYTFMTDIPFLSLFILSLFLYLKGIKGNSSKMLFFAGVSASLAFLVRQTGILLVFSFLLVNLFIIKGATKKEMFRKVLFGTLLPLIVFVTYLIWQRQGDNKTLGQIFGQDRGFLLNIERFIFPFSPENFYTFPSFFLKLLARAFSYVIQLNVFLSSIYFALIISDGNYRKIITTKNILLGALFTLFFLLVTGFLNRFGFDLFNTSFSPELFYFSGFWGMFELSFYRSAWVIFAILSIPLGALFLASYFKSYSKLEKNELLIPLSFGLIFVFTLFLEHSWHEYTIIFVPLLIAILAIFTEKFKINRPVLSSVVFVSLFFSFANSKITHTVLGTTWESATELVESKNIEASRIDIFQFAWYPWWYFEKDFQTELEKYAGDKEKIPNLEFWKDYQNKRPDISIHFTQKGCGNESTFLKEVDEIFVEGKVC